MYNTMADPPDFSKLDDFEDELPVQTLLKSLADPLARYTVYYLCEEGRVSLDHLSDVITGWANANTEQIATHSDRERTQLLLYHVHLPMLDSLDIVEFDPENRLIVIDTVSLAMESFIEWIRRLDQSGGDEEFL